MNCYCHKMTFSRYYFIASIALLIAAVKCRPSEHPGHDGPDPMSWGLNIDDQRTTQDSYASAQQGYYDTNYQYWQPRLEVAGSSTQSAESRAPVEFGTQASNEVIVISDDEQDNTYPILESLHISQAPNTPSSSSRPRKKKEVKPRSRHLEEMGWYDRAAQATQDDLIDSMILLWNYDKDVEGVREKVADRIRKQICLTWARALLDPKSPEECFQQIARTTNRSYRDPEMDQVITTLLAYKVPEYKAKKEARAAFIEGGMRGHTAQEVVHYILNKLMTQKT